MAEARLTSIRPAFVAKVSRPLISKLLDGLLLDRVVNRGEKEWILEENNVREDIARRLIDIVTAKGDTASQRMMDHIQDSDPMLLFDLGQHLNPRVLPESKHPEGTQPYGERMDSNP